MWNITMLLAHIGQIIGTAIIALVTFSFGTFFVIMLMNNPGESVIWTTVLGLIFAGFLLFTIYLVMLVRANVRAMAEQEARRARAKTEPTGNYPFNTYHI